MSDIQILFIEVAVGLVTSIIILGLIDRSLGSALTDLCPTGRLAWFWLTYTRIMILTAPMLLVLITDRVYGGTLFENLRAALIASLTGVIIGMIILGRRMRIPIDRKIGKATEQDR